MLEVIAIYRPLVRRPAPNSGDNDHILAYIVLCVCATRQTYLLFNVGTVL
jgi:hypothetical protein